MWRERLILRTAHIRRMPGYMLQPLEPNSRLRLKANIPLRAIESSEPVTMASIIISVTISMGEGTKLASSIF